MDAETGQIFTVNVKYYEIGQSATAANQLGEGEAGASSGADSTGTGD